LTREERAKAEDQGSYFRVPSDNRDLNYNLFFSEGSSEVREQQDYNSHNTDRLDVEGMKRLLLNLSDIIEVMKRRNRY